MTREGGTEEGGDPACWLAGVCDACGGLVESGGAHECQVGAPGLPAVELDAVTAAGGRDGVLWALASGGDLNANLVSLSPQGIIAEHTNREVDVLVVVLDGAGTAWVDGRGRLLARHSLMQIPLGASRRVHAGPHGLRYLSVHRARPPLGIRPRR